MDLRGSFVRGDTASVQSAEGRNRIVKNRFTFFAQLIVVYTIIITSSVQISLRSPDKELWLILLSKSIGYILPPPGLNFFFFFFFFFLFLLFIFYCQYVI